MNAAHRLEQRKRDICRLFGNTRWLSKAGDIRILEDALAGISRAQPNRNFSFPLRTLGMTSHVR